MPAWVDLISKIDEAAPKADSSGRKEAAEWATDHAEGYVADLEWRRNCRGWLTPWLFGLVVGWLVCVLVVVILDASLCGFSVPENVLTVMLASGSANVIGMFIIVARYLFPKTGERMPPSWFSNSTLSDSRE